MANTVSTVNTVNIVSTVNRVNTINTVSTVGKVNTVGTVSTVSTCFSQDLGNWECSGSGIRTDRQPSEKIKFPCKREDIGSQHSRSQYRTQGGETQLLIPHTFHF